MNLHADGQEGLRRAALTLHALEASDRDWLLAQLPARGRDALARLLRELRELDIPPDARVLRVALNQAPAATALTRDEVHGLAATLADESPALQSLLLATLGEAERRAVLAHWPPHVLGRPDAVAEPAGTEAFRAALLQSWREAASARREET
jgi:hypothetical protein